MEEDSYPSVIVEFFKDIETVTCKEKPDFVRLKSVCKKCKKSIMCNWKPHRVTSNLISHLKVNNATFLHRLLALIVIAIARSAAMATVADPSVTATVAGAPAVAAR